MSDQNELIGKVLGQFELQALIEDNGVIQTFRAYQARLKRHVAVQALAPDFRDEPIIVQGVARGAELIASFEHANIVPIIDYGEQAGFPYIVIRSMQGGLLRTRLEQGAMSISEAANIIRQIGSALDYVHTRGDVHGDPSPLNIGFDHAGSAYIVDFIFIGIFEGMGSNMIGSRRYIAPERWHEEPPTPATDQYALGAIAYHLLTGQAPFEGQDLYGSAQKHLYEMPAPPQTLRPEIHPRVTDVLFRALAKQPEHRYPTVLDFAREFEKAVNAAPQHLFISYSRRDKAFAGELTHHLEQNGFTVWIDTEIEHGDQWFNQIHDAIKTCAAFLVVMTPESENSEWVQKEILLAKRYQKPIFPLLHAGMEFALLIDIQYADVRAGNMPGQDFHRRLSRVVYGAV